MNIVDLIRKKREGNPHTPEEIATLVQGATQGTIPDYQLSAWLMAVCFQGMNEDEVTHLTHYMAVSGDILDLSGVPGPKVDKHSTGGVGDKVTLVLAPLMASAGVVMAKLSGRGLGHTGGTIDKLEAIPGFNTSLTEAAFIQQLKEVGVAVIGQTQNLAPADKVFYALRDVTGTVASIPLIVSSVLSKKLAAGADVIVLDVKYGSGAFMKDYPSAKELARQLVAVGQRLQRTVAVVLSDMDQPLGYAVGHTLEVEEAIETLKGCGPADLKDLCLQLGAILLVGAHRVATLEEGRALLQECLASGAALQKWRAMLQAQGGDPAVIENYSLMPQAAQKVEVTAPTSGYVHHVDAHGVGQAIKRLGAGREKKGDILDLAVGVRLAKKQGDPVTQGETLAVLFVNATDQLELAIQDLQASYTLRAEPPPPPPPLIGEALFSR